MPPFASRGHRLSFRLSCLSSPTFASAQLSRSHAGNTPADGRRQGYSDLESELMLDSGLDSNALHTAAVFVIISSACWAVMAFEGAGRPRGTSVSSSTCFRTSGREVRDLTATEVLDGPPSHRSRTTADGFRPLATPPRPRCCRLQRRPPPSACPSRPGYANRSPARRSTARAQPPSTRPSSPPSAGL